MIIKDVALTTKDEIEARIQSIQNQFDRENNRGCRSNHYTAMDIKLAKLRKFSNRIAVLSTRLRAIGY